MSCIEEGHESLKVVVYVLFDEFCYFLCDLIKFINSGFSQFKRFAVLFLELKVAKDLLELFKIIVRSFEVFVNIFKY